MEVFLEAIIKILFTPFESKYDDLFVKIKNIPNKWLRILLKILIIAIPVALAFGSYILFSFLFRSCRG